MLRLRQAGKLSAEDPQKIITLDPGMAFGTGTHPTTSLTLTALETVLRGGERLLRCWNWFGRTKYCSKISWCERCLCL